MYTFCSKSGVPLQVSDTLFRFRIKVETLHPVFYLETKKLLALSTRQLDDEEVHIIFVALLDRTGLVEFRSPANPSPESCRIHMRKLAWIVDALTVNEEKKLVTELSKLRVSFGDSEIKNLSAILDGWENLLNSGGLSQTKDNLYKPTSKLSSVLWHPRSNLSSANSGLTKEIILWVQDRLVENKDYEGNCVSLLEHIKLHTKKRPANVYKSLPTKLKSKVLFNKLRALINQSVDENENTINKKYTLIRFLDFMCDRYTTEQSKLFGIPTKKESIHTGEFLYAIAELDVKTKEMDDAPPVESDYNSFLEFCRAQAKYNRERYEQ